MKKKINFIYLDFIVFIISADKKYLADVVSISFGKQQLRDVSGQMDLNLFSIPSSNVVFLWWETQKREWNRKCKQEDLTEGKSMELQTYYTLPYSWYQHLFWLRLKAWKSCLSYISVFQVFAYRDGRWEFLQRSWPSAHPVIQWGSIQHQQPHPSQLCIQPRKVYMNSNIRTQE